MADAGDVTRDVLVGYTALTDLVGQRISPLEAVQGVSRPFVTYRRESLEPSTHLRGDAGLDLNRVRVDSWAVTYSAAIEIAAQCRAAMIASNHQLESENDNNEPGVDPGLYNVTQVYTVWT